MCIMKNLFLILSMFLQSSLVLAAAQDHQVLRDTVTAFVQQQTAALPGKTNFQVDDIDSRLVLTACEKLEAFLPTGSQLLGKVSVGVRCAEKHGWSIFVPVQIKVSLNLLVSAQQLSAGHVLQEEDISTQTIEVSQTGGLTNPKQALGKVLRYSISSGQVLREDMLRAPFSVVQGQTVQLVVNGGRFTVRNSGVALNNASEGQFVKVRNQTGGVVGGLAQASGVVEIAP
jgi:flagella basal body P-ring formation protein FlgA